MCRVLFLYHHYEEVQHSLSLFLAYVSSSLLTARTFYVLWILN